MSWFSRAALVALLVCRITHAADADLAKDGRFIAPKKAKQGAAITPKGFVVEGNAKGVTRHVAEKPFDGAVRIEPGAVLVAAVPVPAPRKPEKVDASRWYGVVSMDVLQAELPEGTSAQLRVEARFEDYAPSRTLWVDGGSDNTRLWLHLPAKELGAHRDAGFTLRITAEDGPVVIDDVRFDTFHEEPTRPLVGKPNGHDGPDLLASGMLGFTGLTEHESTVFSLLDIREDGPAARAGLRRSDLVIGVEGARFGRGSLAAGKRWFASGHEATLGRAIEHALAERSSRLSLLVLRGGTEITIEIRLPRMSEREIAERMRADVRAWVAGNQKKDGMWPGSPAVNSSIAGLALLSTRDPAHAPKLKGLVDKLLETNPRARDTKGFSYWSIAYQGIFFCEYYLASGDKRVLAWIEDAIAWLPTTTHACAWGMQAFGHSPKGLPYGEKALMAPCAHLLVFEALAEKCGVTSGVWDHIAPYVMHSWSDPKEGGHGGMGYNAAAKDKAQFWSRTGLVALALHLRQHHERMKDALTAIMVERHPFLLNSHAYGEPGGALGLVALAAIEPEAYRDLMAKWRWRFLNAWEPGFGLRYSSAHMGAPYMGEEAIMNPSYALLFGVEDQGLVLAGAKPARWLPR